MLSSQLPPEIRKLLARQQLVADTNIPAYKLLDALAMPEGDVSALIAKFRDLQDPAMRKAFHDMAVLLRAMESTYLAGAASAAPSPQPPSQSNQSMPSTASTPATKPGKPVPAEKCPDLKQDLNALAACPHVKVHSDGASKGNPGAAGIAFVVADMQSNIVYESCRFIGTATNNVAEYMALIEGMRKMLEMGKRRAAFFSDSQLIVYQVLGRWKINHPEMERLVMQVREMKKQFESFSISAIPRESNRRADFLATLAIRQANGNSAEGAQS